MVSEVVEFPHGKESPKALKIGLGVVLYNNPTNQLSAHSRSINRAIEVAGNCGANTPPPSFVTLVFNNGDPVDRAGIKLRHDRLFEAGDNIGFGKAHNQLMREAFAKGCHYYIGINPDGILHPRCLHEMISMGHKHKGKVLLEAIQVPTEHPKPYNPLTFDTPWISCACFMISAEIFKETGGFDDNLFLYCEDVDLSWNAKVKGFQTKTCPKAWFLHDTSNRKPNPAIEYEMLISGRYLGQKWGVPEYKEHMENLMVEKEMINDKGCLPDLSRVEPIEDPKKWGVIEFGQMFSFADVRWG